MAGPQIRKALAGFGGVKRRFTRTGEWNGATIYDDYGHHHPVEIAAVLKAARASTDKAGDRRRPAAPLHAALLALQRVLHLLQRRRPRHRGRCLCRGRTAHSRRLARRPRLGPEDAWPQVGHADGEPAAAREPRGGPAKPGDYVICLGAGTITQWAYALRASSKPWREGERVRRHHAADPRPGAGFPRRLVANEPLAPLTWFRVGGPAQVLCTPDDEADLAYLLSRLPADMPVMPIGVGSNLIVRDGGVPGIVIRLRPRCFGEVTVEGTRIRAGRGGARPSAWRRPPPRRASAGWNSTSAFPARSAARSS